MKKSQTPRSILYTLIIIREAFRNIFRFEAKYAKQKWNHSGSKICEANGITLEAKYVKQNGGWGMLLEAKWNASRSKIYLSTKQNTASKWNYSRSISLKHPASGNAVQMNVSWNYSRSKIREAKFKLGNAS